MGPAVWVRKRLESCPGNHFTQRFLVLDDCPFVEVGRRVPGVTVPKGVASELMALTEQFLEIFQVKHRPQLGLFAHEAEGYVISSQDVIASQDPTGLEERRSREVVEGK